MQKDKLSNILPLLLALGVFMMYVLGVFYPDIFWGTHFLAFIPSILKYGALVFITLFLSFVYFQKNEKLSFKFNLNKTATVIITVLAAVVFYNLDISSDYYGDAKNFSPYLNQKFTEFKADFWKELFSIQFKTGHARWGVFNFYSLIAYVLKTNMLQTFKLMDAFFGAGFVFIWITAIRKYSTQNSTTILLLILGCTSPVMLNFCGHIETYSLVLFLSISWIYLLVRAFKEKNVVFLWALIPLFIICIRFNTPSIIFLPALVLAFLHHYFPIESQLDSFFSLKKMFQNILIPLFIIGLVAYFFVFKDYNDTRVLDVNTKDVDRLFLPLFSPEAPLNTYNLLSWNHIFDFIMSFFFWSPAVLFLIGIVFIHRKNISWNSSLINTLLLTLVLFLGFLFMINPLMSLPMDWDLYTLPFPLALMLLLLIFQQQSVVFIKKKIILYTLGLHLLAIPVFIVLMNKTMHSYRIESVGVRVYKTYYQHADNYLLYALQMLKGNDTYSIRKELLLKKLQPFVRKPIDQNYAALLLDEGINTFTNQDYKKSRALLLAAEGHAPYLKLSHEYLIKVNNELIKRNFNVPNKDRITADSLLIIGLKNSREKKLYKEAISWFQRASYYDPLNPKIDLFQLEAYFLKKDFKEALVKAEKLTLLKYPNEQQAIRFSIHCALEAAAYEKALYYSKHYLSIWPKDEFIHQICDKLKNNKNLSELKYKFAKIEK